MAVHLNKKKQLHDIIWVIMIESIMIWGVSSLFPTKKEKKGRKGSELGDARCVISRYEKFMIIYLIKVILTSNISIIIMACNGQIRSQEFLYRIKCSLSTVLQRNWRKIWPNWKKWQQIKRNRGNKAAVPVTGSAFWKAIRFLAVSRGIVMTE